METLQPVVGAGIGSGITPSGPRHDPFAAAVTPVPAETALHDAIVRIQHNFAKRTHMLTNQVTVGPTVPTQIISGPDSLRMGLALIIPSAGQIYLGERGVSASTGFGPFPPGLIWVFGPECPDDVWLITAASVNETVGLLILRQKQD